ncbi:MAG: GNAT family N-acetyltransferase, partial [Pseudomonadota bacterium]
MDLHPNARLTTERLHLRPLDAADAPVLVDALGRYDVARWLIAKPYPFELLDAGAMIDAARIGQSWLAWDNKRLVGGVSVENGLGFWVSRPDWGQGYGTEMARAATQAFVRLTPEKALLAGAMTTNAASIRVLEKSGFGCLGHDTAW